MGKGVIQAEGHAKLFEGTYEGTTDLEDTKVVSFTVPRSKSASRRVNLKNTETGGGDHAEIRIVLTNFLIEED